MYNPTLATILDWSFVLGFPTLTLIIFWQIMIRGKQK
jgi:TRAP-type C4-dicarboxylate transport system permease small subunit